jgi:rhodanese-related sulfurtransferase
LRKAGFAKVFNLAGGLGAWRSAGLPTTTKH